MDVPYLWPALPTKAKKVGEPSFRPTHFPSRARGPSSNLYKSSTWASNSLDCASKKQWRGHLSVTRASVQVDQILSEVNDAS